MSLTNYNKRKSLIKRLVFVPPAISLVAALIAIVLSLYGVLTNPTAPALTFRAFLLIFVIAGGTWGLYACAISLIPTLIAILVLGISMRRKE